MRIKRLSLLLILHLFKLTLVRHLREKMKSIHNTSKISSVSFSYFKFLQKLQSLVANHFCCIYALSMQAWLIFNRRNMRKYSSEFGNPTASNTFLRLYIHSEHWQKNVKFFAHINFLLAFYQSFKEHPLKTKEYETKLEVCTSSIRRHIQFHISSQSSPQ